MNFYKAWAALFFITVAHKSFACSCSFPDKHMEQSDSNAYYVFIATPNGKNRLLSPSQNRIKFTNFTFLKGKPDENLKVWSEKLFFGCGQFFNVHKPYVVFAYMEDGKLSTSRCASWVASEYPNSTKTVIDFYEKKPKGE